MSHARSHTSPPGERVGVRAGPRPADKIFRVHKPRECRGTNKRSRTSDSAAMRAAITRFHFGRVRPIPFSRRRPDPDDDGDLELIRKLDGARQSVLRRHWLGYSIGVQRFVRALRTYDRRPLAVGALSEHDGDSHRQRPRRPARTDWPCLAPLSSPHRRMRRPPQRPWPRGSPRAPASA